MSIRKFEHRVLLSPPHMSGHEQEYIQKAFNENWIIPLGPNVNQFESDMVTYLEEENLYAVAMNSGTSAIHIALRLLNVQQGEEIFCSSATFIATANPILYEKAVPVFVDSEQDTWNLCPDSLLKAIEAKKATGKIPRILIVADLFGMSSKYEEILAICEKYKIEVIEDAAEALGSKYHNKKCGIFGRFGILSFNGNKIITTSGGGMLLTHTREEADKAIFLITQARDKAPYYLHSEVGFNYRLSNICAGIGIGQMKVLDKRVESRRGIFKRYAEKLSNSPMIFTQEPEGFYSNRWLSTALLDTKKTKKTPKELIEYLSNLNVEARHIWKPLHTQPIFEKNEFFSAHKKPFSEAMFEEGICLPSGTLMTDETQEKIIEMIQRFF